jgi:hypothetical protein
MKSKNWSYGLVVWPLAVCVLIALAYLQQASTPNVWVALPGLSQTHGKDSHSKLRDPDALRPMIKLHPEDHIFRAPTTQHLDWVVTSNYLRPDGVLKRVYCINGEDLFPCHHRNLLADRYMTGLFPGPTIEARSGDTLVISLINRLEDESISIHWHGLHVKSLFFSRFGGLQYPVANYLPGSMDGAAGVSQCPISPGSKFIYNLTIPENQSGTFWYHAHSGVARADGLYGGLVVHAPSLNLTVGDLMAGEERANLRDNYSKDVLLLIGDWYHRPASQVLAWYMRAGSFGNEVSSQIDPVAVLTATQPVPDSLLINGVGHFNCSMAVPARPVDCVEHYVDLSYLDFDDGLSYRIRVVNTG